MIQLGQDLTYLGRNALPPVGMPLIGIQNVRHRTLCLHTAQQGRDVYPGQKAQAAWVTRGHDCGPELHICAFDNRLLPDTQVRRDRQVRNRL